MDSSILSFPERGDYGDSSYRGNCSGKVIIELLKEFKPKRPMELFAGSGTGYDAARSLGYTNSIHLDLNPRFGSFNLLKDELPHGSDFIFSHPPYWKMVQYSGKGNMWGNEPHEDDLSHAPTYKDFIDKIDRINGKAHASLTNGGYHAILIGDYKYQGRFYPIQKDMCWIGEPYAHIIKEQHNMMSNFKNYHTKKPFVPITHEHLIILKKRQVWQIPLRVTKMITCDLLQSLKITWRDLVQATIQDMGGQATLNDLYEKLKDSAKAKKNQHFKEKIRQTLQINDDFTHVERGKWSLSFI